MLCFKIASFEFNKEATKGNAMGSVSELSSALSLLLLELLLSLMLLLILLMLMLLLLLLPETEVVLLSAKAGWRGTRRMMVERAPETSSSILRSVSSADSSLLCQVSHLRRRLAR